MVALKSRGYQVRGTMIVRPSARATASVSSVRCTSRTRSPELRWEAFIPFLQETIAILCHAPVDSPKLHGTEAKVSGQRNRVQPELCRLIVAIHVNMGRLVRLMAVKIQAVWPDHQYGWHAFQYLTAVPRIPAALLSIRCRARRWVPKRGRYHFPLYWATRQRVITSRAPLAGTSTR